MRTCDIGLELEIPKTSINALMQYLKRKNAVRTQTDARFAPYDLTPTGREILDAMNRAKSSRSDVIVSPARLAGFVSQHASSRP